MTTLNLRRSAFIESDQVRSRPTESETAMQAKIRHDEIDGEGTIRQKIRVVIVPGVDGEGQENFHDLRELEPQIDLGGW